MYLQFFYELKKFDIFYRIFVVANKNNKNIIKTQIKNKANYRIF